MQTELHTVSCPYCGENFDAVIDASEGDHAYIEDCYVCCRPITFRIGQYEDGSVQVMVQHENEC